MSIRAPEQALNVLESSLRSAMRVALFREFGPSWLEKFTKDEQRERWQSRLEADRPRKGTIPTPLDLLDYVELYHLIEIVRDEAAWEFLKPFFGDRSQTLALLDTFERFRNAIAHNRSLAPFERDLASGIAGRIQNQVITHLSNLDEAGQYYPMLTWAQDAFGREYDEGPRFDLYIAEPKVRLRPGDVLTLKATAADVQGRDLEWSFGTSSFRLEKDGFPYKGNTVEVSYKLTTDDIGGNFVPALAVRAVGATYHRFLRRDAQVEFYYEVLPPLKLDANGEVVAPDAGLSSKSGTHRHESVWQRIKARFI